MKKVLALFLITGAIIPSMSVLSVEAGVSPEGIHRRRPRCKRQGKVVVCRMPRVRRPRRCGIIPCIPDGYYRRGREIPLR